MRYYALASDYDGTLARDGAVDAATISSLEAVRDSGRKLLLVTGRELPELLQVFPRIDLFDLVVAENGALLYWPATKDEQVLAPEPSARFVEALKARGVTRLSCGRSIIAAWRPDEATILRTIRELGLDLQVIFNKDAVMILPPGVNKATGLTVALAALSLPAQSVVGVGDAENDLAFLKMCGCSAAVANALPSVKETATLVTQSSHGNGVQELVTALLANDLEYCSAASSVC